jgi:tetratricopeptide (TPR) repeat protein
VLGTKPVSNIVYKQHKVFLRNAVHVVMEGWFIKGKFILILIVFAVLCMPAFGMTANDWVEKGNAFFYQSRYDGAIQAYDKAIEETPQLVEAWNNKGLALEDMGKYDEAIKTDRKSTRLNSSH